MARAHLFAFALLFIAIIGMASALPKKAKIRKGDDDSDAPSSEAAASPDGPAAGPDGAAAAPDGAAAGPDGAAGGPGAAAASSRLQVPAIAAGVAAAVVAGYVF